MDTLHETAARGVEALGAIVQERDRLRQINDRMQTDIALLREKNDQLDRRLSVASVERDHYLRYATEITSRLNNIQTLISTTLEAASTAAFRPSIIPKPEKSKLDDIDTKAIEGLIKRLPVNGGEKPTA